MRDQAGAREPELERRLRNRLDDVDEDRNGGLHDDRLGPNYFLPVYTRLNKQLVCAERHPIEFKLSGGGDILYEFRSANTEFTSHLGSHVTECFKLSSAFEVNEGFLLRHEIGFEKFPVIVQARLNLSIPGFDIFGGKKSDSGLRDGFGTVGKFHNTDEGPSLRCLRES